MSLLSWENTIVPEKPAPGYPQDKVARSALEFTSQTVIVSPERAANSSPSEENVTKVTPVLCGSRPTSRHVFTLHSATLLVGSSLLRTASRSPRGEKEIALPIPSVLGIWRMTCRCIKSQTFAGPYQALHASSAPSGEKVTPKILPCSRAS